MTFKHRSNWQAGVLTRRREFVVGAVVAALVVALIRFLVPTATDGVAPTPSDSVRAAPPASQAVLPTAVVRQDAASVPSDARTELASRMKADWCHVGAAAQLRRLSLSRQLGDPSEVARDASEALADKVNDELMRDATDQARQRWISELMKRSDPRAQALADLLNGDDESRARLQARARSSGDPVLTEMAMLRPCDRGACRNIEASQWSRLEPANVQAWVALLVDPDSARGMQQGYVLERIASEARYSRSFKQEALQILLGVVSHEAPGFHGAAEAEAFMSMRVNWGGLQGAYPLIHECRRRPLERALSDRCLAMAELFWRDGDVQERSDAFKLVQATLAARPGLRPAWEAREQSFLAHVGWQQNDLDRWWKRLMPTAGAPTSPCQFLTEQRQMMREFAGRSEWDNVAIEMRNAGVDEADLAAQTRRARNGRGVLDTRN